MVSWKSQCSLLFRVSYESEWQCKLLEIIILTLLPVPIDDVQVTSMTEGVAVAGQQYRIICTVTFPLGLTNPIAVQWYDSNGIVSSGNGITLGGAITSTTNITSAIAFNPLRTSHGGQFSCRATITSSAPPYSLTRSVDVDILVEGRLPVYLKRMQYHDYVI